VHQLSRVAAGAAGGIVGELRMGGMVASVAAALVVVLGVASVATAQLETCNGDLPPVLAANYSGLACQPVWNNFVLRVRMLFLFVLRMRVVGVWWIIELLECSLLGTSGHLCRG